MDDPIKLYFELEDDSEADRVMNELSEGFANLEGLRASEVQTVNQRLTGAEIVASIGAAILIAKTTKDAIDAVREVISSITELVRDVKGLKAVVVETRSGPRNLQDVTPTDFN